MRRGSSDGNLRYKPWVPCLSLGTAECQSLWTADGSSVSLQCCSPEPQARTSSPGAKRKGAIRKVRSMFTASWNAVVTSISASERSLLDLPQIHDLCYYLTQHLIFSGLPAIHWGTTFCIQTNSKKIRRETVVRSYFPSTNWAEGNCQTAVKASHNTVHYRQGAMIWKAPKFFTVMGNDPRT